MAMLLGLLGLSSLGCVEKTVFPAAEIRVTKVDPFLQSPAGGTTATAGTTTLEGVKISLHSDNGVPAALVGYAITYRTLVGDVIPQLEIGFTSMELAIPPAADSEVVIQAYSQAVIDYYRLTPSRVEPIEAAITLFFRDEHGHDLTRAAHCRLDRATT